MASRRSSRNVKSVLNAVLEENSSELDTESDLDDSIRDPDYSDENLSECNDGCSDDERRTEVGLDLLAEDREIITIPDVIPATTFTNMPVG